MNSKEWHEKHRACPECGSTKTKQSLVGVIEVSGHYQDNVNTADCNDCGWAGMVKNLKPGPEKIPQAGEVNEEGREVIKLELKTIDVDGQTYVCAQDMVNNIRSFNNKLDEKLTDDGTKRYTSQLLSEIVGMIVIADKQHWINRTMHKKTQEKSLKDSSKKNKNKK